MRLIQLSDHPGQLLQDARAHRDTVRVRRRWWSWIAGIFSVRAKRRNDPTAVEESIAAGMAGERRAAAELGRVLDDEWILFRGYRNRRGEIDHLLLGPGGLFAIEVKYRNATVYVHGDDWQFAKFDSWGNKVDQGRITDATGRSPSVQLNEPADELERFLHSRRQPVSVTRVVLLNHARSKVGRCQDLTVHVATSSDYIIDLVNASAVQFRDRRITQLERLIERDHRFHNGRR
jgi:Nuclease-related domain